MVEVVKPAAPKVEVVKPKPQSRLEIVRRAPQKTAVEKVEKSSESRKFPPKSERAPRGERPFPPKKDGAPNKKPFEKPSGERKPIQRMILRKKVKILILKKKNRKEFL